MARVVSKSFIMLGRTLRFVEPVSKLSLASLMIYLFAAKAYWLHDSTDNIEAEVLQSSRLSDAGRAAAARLYENKFRPADHCAMEACDSKEERRESALLLLHKFFMNSVAQLPDHEQVESYLEKLGLPLDPQASYRGREMHHYNTILYPFREAKDGNLGYLLTAQNGLVSLLPLVFMQHAWFVDYNVVGIAAAVLLFGFAMLRNFKKLDFYSVALIGLLVAFTIQEGAVRIHPGFSYIRFLPLLAMTVGISGLLKRPLVSMVFFYAACSLLNAAQFNILIVAVMMTVFIAHLFINRESLYELLFGCLAIGAVTLVQAWLFEHQKNIFSTTMFGSVGEANYDFLFSSYIVLFPLSVFLIGLLNAGFRFSRATLAAYVSYFAFATYSITQATSLQHFSGFLFVAAVSSFLLLKSLPTFKLRAIPMAVFLLFPVVPKGFYAFPDRVREADNPYFASEQIGEALTFSTNVDFKSAIEEYENLKTKYGAWVKGVYFLSKDKIYFETKLDRVIEPAGYDVFVAAELNENSRLEEMLKAQGVNFLIIDSPMKRRVDELFVQFAGYQLHNSEETARYIKLLTQYDWFETRFAKDKAACSERYCLYKF